MVPVAGRHHPGHSTSRRVQGRQNILSGGALEGIRQRITGTLAGGTEGGAMTVMTDQTLKAEQFRGLHIPGKPFVLFNVWDAGSAEAVANAGAKALATSSWSVANANGFADGERIPVALAIENLRRIVSASELPVTIDLESGYGATPDAVGETVRLTIDTGAVGCNLEDSFPANGRLRGIADQCDRIRRARQMADTAHIQFFLNVRTDIFFQTPPEQHT